MKKCGDSSSVGAPLRSKKKGSGVASSPPSPPAAPSGTPPTASISDGCMGSVWGAVLTLTSITSSSSDTDTMGAGADATAGANL